MIRWQRCARLYFPTLLIMVALPLTAVQADESDERADEPDPDIEVVELTEEELEALQPQPDDLQDPVVEELEAEPGGCSGGDADSSVLCAPDPCTPRTVYTTTRVIDRHRVVNPLTLRNDSNQTVDWEISVTCTDTMTYHVAGTVSAQIKAIFAEISATLEGGVSNSITTTIGNNAKVKVLPRSTLHADYSIFLH